jgi:hypothetical protein
MPILKVSHRLTLCKFVTTKIQYFHYLKKTFFRTLAGEQLISVEKGAFDNLKRLVDL